MQLNITSANPFGDVANQFNACLDLQLRDARKTCEFLEEKVKKLGVAVAEQNCRRDLGVFGRGLLSRVDTITPLIEACKALKNLSDRIAILKANMADSRTTPDKRATCTAALELIEKSFERSQKKVASAVGETTANSNQWNRWCIVQWWSNVDEAVVVSANRRDFMNQARILTDSGLMDPPQGVHENEVVAQLAEIEERAIQSHAAWNTGLKITANIGLGALTLGGLVAVGMMTGDLDRMMKSVNQSVSSHIAFLSQSMSSSISSLTRSIGAYRPSFFFR